MDTGNVLAIVSTCAAGIGAAGIFEEAFHHGNPRGASIRKRSHSELNGIEVENVPRSGDGRSQSEIKSNGLKNLPE
jgi:hypothetical protein